MSKFPSVSGTQPESTDLEEAQMPTESSHETILSCGFNDALSFELVRTHL